MMAAAFTAEQIRKANRTPEEVAAEDAEQQRIAMMVKRAMASLPN